MPYKITHVTWRYHRQSKCYLAEDIHYNFSFVVNYYMQMQIVEVNNSLQGISLDPDNSI